MVFLNSRCLLQLVDPALDSLCKVLVDDVDAVEHVSDAFLAVSSHAAEGLSKGPMRAQWVGDEQSNTVARSPIVDASHQRLLAHEKGIDLGEVSRLLEIGLVKEALRSQILDLHV